MFSGTYALARRRHDPMMLMLTTYGGGNYAATDAPAVRGHPREVEMEFSQRDRWALLARPILVLVCVSLTGALAVEASATSLGVLVDVYSGNDSESAIAANLASTWD